MLLILSLSSAITAMGDELKALLEAVTKLQPLLADPTHFSELKLVSYLKGDSSDGHKSMLQDEYCSKLPLISLLLKLELMVLACGFLKEVELCFWI